ncbi:MAG: class I SAM-dependent methyltransferase [Desulfovibrio sp.]|jgi:SAM-dependent methyltransferase|nr:class I SAM-dependent methyltransferase [Desulfovibrio sp.]
MTVFTDYARYYNLLYKDKDYAGETDFVLGILRKHGQAASVLDLGCGTGRHAVEMARRGIEATGVDMSETMLVMGKEALDALAPTEFSVPLPDLRRGDARTARLGGTFDAVVSLFHVMSYQNTEEDALSVMKTAKTHLKPGGLFLFDFWYGPGVLTEPPTERHKVMEDGDTLVCRHAKPIHRINDNIVDVHYTIELTNKTTGAKSELRELHAMRYWFMPELHYLVRQAGFTLVAEGGWLNDHAPDSETWNAWMAASRL